MAQRIDLAVAINVFLTRPVTVNKVIQYIMLYWLCIMLQILKKNKFIDFPEYNNTQHQKPLKKYNNNKKTCK